MSARARWWAGHVGVAAVCIVAAAMLAWDGEWLSAVLSAALGINMLLARATQRHTHTIGWCRGYGDGTQDELARALPGLTSATDVRLKDTGRLVPEPWEGR